MDRIAASILAAAAIIAVAIFLTSNTPPRYQGFAIEGEIYRLDTRTGEVIACDAERCMQAINRDQYAEPNTRKTFLEKALENQQNPAAH